MQSVMIFLPGREREERALFARAITRAEQDMKKILKLGPAMNRERMRLNPLKVAAVDKLFLFLGFY